MMRILAGRFKGRNLLSPPATSPTRPITGAVKKSLFDTISGFLVDATVVDLYCGTGTLGIEALSRGARRCFFAERDRAAIQRLRQNIAAIGAEDCCTIWSGDVLARLAGWLAGMEGSVDVAFVDPPFAQVRQWDWRRIAETIFVPLAGRLSPDGLIVVRLPIQADFPRQIGALEVLREREYGGVKVLLLGKIKQGCQ